MDELDRIDGIKKKLSFTKTLPENQGKKTTFHPVISNAKKGWDTMKKPLRTFGRVFSHRSIFKQFFFISLIFFFGALAAVAFIFYRGSTSISNENIDIAILGNAFTPGGEELALQVSITNRNKVGLELADIVIEYPKGTQGDSELARIRKNVGTIDSGKTINEAFPIILFGEQGSIKDITATLEYRIAGSNALFFKEQTYTVTISTAPLLLTIDAPTTVSTNQEVTFTVKAVLNADRVASDMIMRVEYPPGFRFTSATPAPTLATSVWQLGDLRRGVTKEISITGVLAGQDQDERTFRIYAGERARTDQSQVGVVYNSLLHTIRIERSFLNAQLVINGEEKAVHTLSGSSSVNGQIRWQNSLPSRIINARITVSLSGNAFDPNRVAAQQGIYDPRLNTIVWDRDSLESFAIVDPDSSGTVSFTLVPLPAVGQNRTFLDNPEITVTVAIEGVVEDGGAGEVISTSESSVIRLGSDMQLVSAVTPAAPLPPVVDQEIPLTVIWTVSNTTNPVTDAVVRAVLPSNVRFIGQPAPADEQVTFNQLSREVTWRAGTVRRGSGFSGTGRQVTFQVALRPTALQVGTVPPIVQAGTITGTDTFTGGQVRATTMPLLLSESTTGGSPVVVK